ITAAQGGGAPQAGEAPFATNQPSGVSVPAYNASQFTPQLSNAETADGGVTLPAAGASEDDGGVTLPAAGAVSGFVMGGPVGALVGACVGALAAMDRAEPKLTRGSFATRGSGSKESRARKAPHPITSSIRLPPPPVTSSIRLNPDG